jgi:hypothetical protein
LQQVASTRPKERKKAERLRLNSTYFIIWFPKLGERLSNTAHFICCLNGRKHRIFIFCFIFFICLDGKIIRHLIFRTEESLLILFFNYISLSDWKFQFCYIIPILFPCIRRNITEYFLFPSVVHLNMATRENSR